MCVSSAKNGIAWFEAELIKRVELEWCTIWILRRYPKNHRCVIYQIFRQISVSGETWFHAMSRPWSGVPRTITASFPVSNDMRCRGAKGKVHPFGRIHNDLYLPFIAHQALTHDLFAIFTTLTANFRTPTLQASTRTDYSHGLSISFLTNLHREASNEEISTFDRFTSFHPFDRFHPEIGFGHAWIDNCEAYGMGDEGASETNLPKIAATSPSLNAALGLFAIHWLGEQGLALSKPLGRTSFLLEVTCYKVNCMIQTSWSWKQKYRSIPSEHVDNRGRIMSLSYIFSLTNWIPFRNRST